MRGIQKGLTLVTVVIALLGACGRAAAQVAMTTIQDTVYEASGTPASGTVVVTWPTFTTAAGQAVAAGNTSATIGANGALTIALAPNADATPTGTYYTAVLHLADGTTTQQYWVVPVSATPVTLASIQNDVLPTSVAMQTASRAYVNAQIAAAVSGGSTTTGTTGSYVPTTGGTMTGPLVLPADPVTPNQAADKHYVDTNVAALAAGVGQKISMVPTVTQTVSQPAGTQLQVNALNGELYASQFQTTDGGAGIAGALTSPGCGAGCTVVVDPSYTVGEPLNTALIPNNGHVVDLRNGTDQETFVNPVSPSYGSSTAELINQISTNSDANSPAAGSGVGSTRITLSLSNSAFAGGSNQLPGEMENPPYGKANYGVTLETGNYFTEGQHVQNEHVVNCHAVGDCLEGSWVLMSDGGYRDAADEGAHPFDLDVTENPQVFQGTCSSGCTTGSTSLFVNATAAGGSQGEGRFLIDKNPAKTITAGQIVSSDWTIEAEVKFTGTSFPASVFLQTAAAALSQPKVLAPGTVTLPIVTTNAPGGFATNTNQLPAPSGVACIADTNDSRFPNFETANYTVVDATHITLTLNKVHASSAVIAVGGLCGYGIEQTVDTVNGIRQLFPVIGSSSSNSLYYAAATTAVLGSTNAASTSAYQNVSAQVSSIARSGNVVTVTLSSNLPVDLTGVTMTVSGVADTSYNGSFKVTTTAANQLTYSNTGPDGTSSGGTVSLLTGGFVLYPAAEVLGVYDSNTKQVDGQLTLAANTVAWATGDAVEEPHFYQQLTAPDTEFVTQYVPRPIQYSSAGKYYEGEVGPGMRGWAVQNGVLASNYLGAGGTHELPDDAYLATGPWTNDFEVDAGAQAIIRAHCNLHGCNRWDSGYNLFDLDAATGQNFLYYSPVSSTLYWLPAGQSYAFGPSGMSIPGNLSVPGSLTMGKISGTNSGFASTNTSVALSQSGDQYGATSLTLENRNGLNGALFANAGLDLVDFGFLGKSGYQSNIRVTASGFIHGYNNAKGEFDFATNVTNQSGNSIGALYMGGSSAQFYGDTPGMVSINVPSATNPNAALAVNGSVSVGSYAGTVAAPANGLIVSGSVGVGSSAPAGLLSVGGSNQFQVDAAGDVTASTVKVTGAAPTEGASCTANGSILGMDSTHLYVCIGGTVKSATLN